MKREFLKERGKKRKNGHYRVLLETVSVPGIGRQERNCLDRKNDQF